ncbi:hypothetical protein [Alloprevotella tannerae]|uniref:hypothetical protein n=1 Tax=Alloprevotella tannerae TaxID=76122 RepID=UPI00241CAAED|nr:hypothetical protein [Alloprevotella tannerae]
MKKCWPRFSAPLGPYEVVRPLLFRLTQTTDLKSTCRHHMLLAPLRQQSVGR